MLYVFDIDGVLADVTHLLPLITGENKDYETYYSRIGEAKVLHGGRKLLNSFKMHKLHFVTGRRESSREVTTEWLSNYYSSFRRYNAGLYMRSNQDFRPAHEVKYDAIHKVQLLNNVAFQDMIVFEDDPQCAEMYESLGCYVCHVRHDKAKS